MISRRKFLSITSLALAGAATIGVDSATAEQLSSATPARTRSPVAANARVITPNGTSLPWHQVGDTKVYHLIAEPIVHQMAEGLNLDLWGYNGRSPGPTIEAVEGDRVRIYVSNRLPAPTTVHWHGVELPNGMDGVAGLNQAPIPAGETFKYEFRFPRPGTFMYHPHFDELTQIALGMMGMIVVHPRRTTAANTVERDFAIMLAEWSVRPGARRPNPAEMSDFNLATMNSKVFPATEALVVGLGDRVRIRLCNLSVTNHHPIHLHGHNFRITASEGGRIPASAQWPESTVLIPTGSVREIEFVADAPGDWALHCHMLHHVMNQMGHAGPPMIGVDSSALNARLQPLLPGYMTMGAAGMADMGDMGDMQMAMPENSIVMKGGQGPFGHIDMAGMFTILKVREGLTSYDDPGWYDHPANTVARAATPAELERDGIATPQAPPAQPDHEHDH
ncbi:MAG: copper oxidase [Bradymonadaceae bacterium]|nr:copper oxidase [Lujinxingiaceae bacterium]